MANDSHLRRALIIELPRQLHSAPGFFPAGGYGQMDAATIAMNILRRIPMKRLFLTLPLIALLFSLTACGSGGSSQAAISQELDVDVSSGQVLSFEDSHGGFHGDGTAFVVLSFPDDRVLREIEEAPQWKPLPLDRTVKALAYGVSDAAGSTGPFLTDGGGNPLLPEIQRGYYLLIDRQADSGSATVAGILDRSSFNFTLSLYDADTQTLYYCRMDT